MMEVLHIPEKKGHWIPKWRRNIPRAGEKTGVNWKNDLQIRGAGRKSRKSPAPVLGNKLIGKSQLNRFRSEFKVH
jgi:hypothetical protein